MLARILFVFALLLSLVPINSSSQEIPAEGGERIKAKGADQRVNVDVRGVNITMDLNLDGRVTPDDDVWEEEHGMVVIRDQDGVYGDTEEPARRRMLIIQDNDPKKDSISLERSSDNLRIFTARQGGAELHFKNNMVVVPAGICWVQGGVRASKILKDEFLKAYLRHLVRGGPSPTDEIKITVLWVDLEVRQAKADDEMLKPPVFDGYEAVKRMQGHAKLGVHRSKPGSSDTDKTVRAIAEFHGHIRPNFSSVNYDRKALSQPLTTNLRGGGVGKRVKADFGFVFRRVARYVIYKEGLVWLNASGDKKTARENEIISQPDDSEAMGQDTNPDRHGRDFLIVDNDGPGRRPTSNDPNFLHYRANFVEHVVFRYQKTLPHERISNKVKWAISLDWGWNYENQAVFVVSRPNDGDLVNEVLHNSHLPDLDLKLQRPVIESVRITKIDGRVPNKTESEVLLEGSNVELTVTGKNLIGYFDLIPLQPPNEPAQGFIPGYDIPGQVIRVRASNNDEFADSSEIRLTFHISYKWLILKPDQRYGIRMSNLARTVKGESEFNYSNVKGQFLYVK